jgi:CRISPR-associated exonuclease Cas4
MGYAEDEYLQIAEIQHFAFCPRQWALAYLEQQWQENVLTVEGHALHDKAHDESIKEKRRGRIIVRGMRIASSALGISGDCDVVEFIEDKDGVAIPSYQGRYRVVPVEYKRGHPKAGEEDVLQLTLQAMCLEDMLATQIAVGYLYYGEIRHRSPVEFRDEMKQHIRDMLREMRQYIRKGYTPKVKPHKGCKKCSLQGLCLPGLKRQKSAKEYVAGRLAE